MINGNIFLIQTRSEKIGLLKILQNGPDQLKQRYKFVSNRVKESGHRAFRLFFGATPELIGVHVYAGDGRSLAGTG